MASPVSTLLAVSGSLSAYKLLFSKCYSTGLQVVLGTHQLRALC